MRALFFDGGSAKVVQRDAPLLAPGRAIVAMRRAGICNTDLELAKGYMGFRGVLGHELLGVVDEGPPAWIGKRVVAEINFACGACAFCAKGLSRHCEARTVMGILNADGAFAERVSVPTANLHVVPKELADDRAVFAEPLAAAFEVIEQVPIFPGVRAIVVGDGKLGFLVAQVLMRAGAKVLVVGKHQALLDRIALRGADTILANAWSPESARADIVVEASGSARGLEGAIAATKPRGTLVLKSTVADKTTVNLAPVVVNEISIVGSRCGPFAPALAALSANEIDVEPLIAARYPLARAEEALARAAEPGAMKILLENDL